MIKIKLNKPFGSGSKVDEFDTRQVKRVLNRLGYYVPPSKTGTTSMPDSGVFKALKQFQKDNGLPPDGRVKPGDATEAALNEAATLQNPNTQYIWQTMDDEKVRSSHADRDGKVYSWSTVHDDGHPGEPFGCRCWAEPVTADELPPDDGIEPVYPELLFLPLFKVGRGAFALATKIVGKVFKRLPKSRKENLTDHGSLRVLQRKVTQKEIETAIETAKKTGSVKIKIGKYGTPQIHYRGSNGITVIVETSGRNAGKVITLYRH